MARSMPRIYAALEKQQSDHPNYMVEIEGMINNQPIFILIDPGARLTYISPSVVKESILWIGFKRPSTY